MNAMLCDIDIEINSDRPAPLLAFSRTGVAPALQKRCPYCDSIIYSRRHKLCGVCAAELPAECRFDPAQSENVKALVREEQLRHRAWMQRSIFAN